MRTFMRKRKQLFLIPPDADWPSLQLCQRDLVATEAQLLNGFGNFYPVILPHSPERFRKTQSYTDNAPGTFVLLYSGS